MLAQTAENPRAHRNYMVRPLSGRLEKLSEWQAMIGNQSISGWIVIGIGDGILRKLPKWPPQPFSAQRETTSKKENSGLRNLLNTLTESINPETILADMYSCGIHAKHLLVVSSRTDHFQRNTDGRDSALRLPFAFLQQCFIFIHQLKTLVHIFCRLHRQGTAFTQIRQDLYTF